jgi:predicted acyl esterase
VNGAFDLWFFAGEQFIRNLEAKGLPPADVAAQAAAWVAAGRANILTDWVWKLPLDSFTEFRDLAPYYCDWIAHPNYDEYWAKLDVETRYQHVEVPALNIGGWYDIFQIGTVPDVLLGVHGVIAAVVPAHHVGGHAAAEIETLAAEHLGALARGQVLRQRLKAGGVVADERGARERRPQGESQLWSKWLWPV